MVPTPCSKLPAVLRRRSWPCRRFDPKQAHVVSQWPHDRPLNACRFDPTGRFVFCGSEDAAVERFKLADGARTVLKRRARDVGAIAGVHQRRQHRHQRRLRRQDYLVGDRGRHAEADSHRSRPTRAGSAGSTSAPTARSWPAAAMTTSSASGTSPTVHARPRAAGPRSARVQRGLSSEGPVSAQRRSHRRASSSGTSPAARRCARSTPSRCTRTKAASKSISAACARLAVSPDGKWLAAGGLYKATNPLGAVHEPIVLLFDWESQKVEKQQIAEGIPGGVAMATALAGRRLAHGRQRRQHRRVLALLEAGRRKGLLPLSASQHRPRHGPASRRPSSGDGPS